MGAGQFRLTLVSELSGKEVASEEFSIRKRGIKGICRQCKEKHGSYRRAGIKANVYA